MTEWGDPPPTFSSVSQGGPPPPPLPPLTATGSGLSGTDSLESGSGLCSSGDGGGSGESPLPVGMEVGGDSSSIDVTRLTSRVRHLVGPRCPDAVPLSMSQVHCFCVQAVSGPDASSPAGRISPAAHCVHTGCLGTRRRPRPGRSAPSRSAGDRQTDRQTEAFPLPQPQAFPLPGGLENHRSPTRPAQITLGGRGEEEEKNNKKQKRKNSLSFRSFALRRVGAAPGGPVPPHAPRV